MLLLYRWATYAAIFILSLIGMEDSLTRKALFSFLFLIILLISSLRISYFVKHIKLFTATIAVEMLLIVILSFFFNSLAFVCAYVSIVDVFLFFKGKNTIFMSLLVYLSLLPNSFFSSHNYSMKYVLLNYTISIVSISFFAVFACLLRREKSLAFEMNKLNEELRVSKAELETANKKLSEYASKVEEISILDERNRLAGEIHDNIGHRLTGLIMEMDICSKLIDKDINKTKLELEKAADLARNTLEEVRKSVRKIKPSDLEETSGISSMKELIRDFEKNTGIFVTFKVTENRYKLSPTVEVTLYRAIQEALTNSAKHGNAKNISIFLAFRKEKVYLELKNDGDNCSEIIKGVGLKSMEERIHMLGGSINFEGKEGFSIYIEIPVEV